MSNRIALLLAVLCVCAADGVVSTAAAQARSSDAGQWEVPRTPDGHPDLQGNWTNVTLTPFERGEDHGPLYTWEEVAEIERPSGDCPANPGTVACGRAESTTGSAEVRLRGQEYSEVYWDRGSRIAIVNGEPRPRNRSIAPPMIRTTIRTGIRAEMRAGLSPEPDAYQQNFRLRTK